MADETPGEDILEQAGRRSHLPSWHLPDWRPSRGAQLLAVVALAVGLAAGYAAGGWHTRGSAAQPASSATASPNAFGAPGGGSELQFTFSGSPTLTQDPGVCSVQVGKHLEIGVKLTAMSAQPLTLTTVKVKDAMGALKQLTWHWGTCGALANGLGQGVNILMPAESTWLTVTFQVKVACPAPQQVKFSVGYLVQGHAATASLPGIVDLAEVPYIGCAGTS
ncbi:MAG: hypothetical protein ACRDNW_12500 [Trebonia sp.]